MRLITRKTHNFVEIEVDEIETTIFKSERNELIDMIITLLETANDLASYTDKSLIECVKHYGF